MKRIQEKIIKELGVIKQEKGENRKDFIERIIKMKTDFLKNYMDKPAYCLGLSGGVDSFVASMLAKNAGAYLVNIAMPNGEQYDFEDVLAAKEIIKPDVWIEKNIALSVNAIDTESKQSTDLTLGNIAARTRMIVQYDIASKYNCLVIGTDHATEAITGFYTKYGDGGCDVAPLSGLTKDVIYEIAEYFNAPKSIMSKAPSAGLWPGQTDENELGLTYKVIVDYLNGKTIPLEDRFNLERRYFNTSHKRHMPATSIYDNEKAPKGILFIDCQYDFMSEGALPCLNDKSAIETMIAYSQEEYNDYYQYFTKDYHSTNHCSFIENGGIWPPHCVQNTTGSDIPFKLAPYDGGRFFFKGTDDTKEEYSAINSKNSNGLNLTDCLPQEVVVCGFATEFCVKETVLDLLDKGFKVTILVNGLGYINKENHLATLRELENKGCKLDYFEI